MLPFPPKRPRRLKRLTKHQILENILPFYDSVGILRREHAHRYCAKTYIVEVIDNKNLDDSIFLSKSSINNLFRDLLREKRGFKYNLLSIITLKRWNNEINTYDIETIHIKTKAITVTNQRFNLNSAYEELKHRLDIWTGLGSGWIIDSIEAIFIDMANYDQLAGSSYIPLLSEIKNPKKGLINIKHKDDECWFKWCNIRFLKRIKKQDKEIAKTLDYRGVNFPLKARDYEIVEERFNINVNVFGYENKVFPLYVSKKSNEQVLNVLLISNEEKSHYVFIKDFNRLMYSKTKYQHKKHFCMSCL